MNPRDERTAADDGERSDPHHEEATIRSTSRPAPASAGRPTIKTRVTNVRQVFRAAVRDRLIATDPCAGVVLPRQRKREAAMRIPTPQQVRVLLDAAHDFRPVIAVMAFSGLRLAETAGLQVGDVDFLRRKIAVSRQVQRTRAGGVEIRLPKYGSERQVFVADELLQILSQHLATGTGAPWLFSESDMPRLPSAIWHRWRRTLTAAGLSGIRLHDLRHFYASGLIASGCDVVTVQRARGHSSASTTLNTYSHLWPSAEDRTRAGAAAMMAEVLTTPADSVRTEGGD